MQTSDARIPATVLTGFLGSGKTTLLNRLLRAPHGLRLAVVVNELGAVGIDGKVVAGGERFVELDNGCLCCVLNEDLQRVLTDLRARGGFDHLVIETTGLADPLPIAWIFSRPGLADFYRLDAIAAVADCQNLERLLGEAPEAKQQLVRADLLLLSKLDLVADGGARARARLTELNPLAPLIPAEHGELPWQLLLAPEVASRPLPQEGPHQHRVSLDSHVVSLEHPVDERALEDMLAEVPTDVYRVKGLVRGDDPEVPWILVNVVAGRVDLHACTPPRPPAQGTLVFIGQTLDKPALTAMCRAL